MLGKEMREGRMGIAVETCPYIYLVRVNDDRTFIVDIYKMSTFPVKKPNIDSYSF
jgi:hypothetical protein